MSTIAIAHVGSHAGRPASLFESLRSFFASLFVRPWTEPMLCQFVVQGTARTIDRSRVEHALVEELERAGVRKVHEIVMCGDFKILHTSLYSNQTYVGGGRNYNPYVIVSVMVSRRKR